VEKGLGVGVRGPFNQLDSIAERVFAEESHSAFDRLIGPDMAAARGELVLEKREIVDCQRNVRLACRTEVLLDAEMELKRTDFKPAAAAAGKLFGLGNFTKPQQPAVERARRLFPAQRNRDLNVFEAGHQTVEISGASSAFMPTTL